jgi:hypothetical protein
VIVADNKPYTTQLQAGLGLVNETRMLLDLWSPGMSANRLHQVALESGRFPTVTARRLRNIVVECFAPRYLVTGGTPAMHLKRLAPTISTVDLTQLLPYFPIRGRVPGLRTAFFRPRRQRATDPRRLAVVWPGA